MTCITSSYFCTGLPAFAVQKMAGQYCFCTDTTYDDISDVDPDPDPDSFGSVDPDPDPEA